MIKRDLLDYLPEYYYDSPQFNELMKVSQQHIPDAEGQLWKAFFLSLGHEWSKELWEKELNSYDPGLYSILRNKVFNKEFTDSIGINVKETWVEMPYDGLVLSEFGVMADGYEYNVLTNVIMFDIDDGDKINFYKRIVRFLRIAGYEYLYQISSYYRVTTPDSKVDKQPSSSLYLGVPSVHTMFSFDDYISGKKMDFLSMVGMHLFATVKTDRSYLFDDRSIYFNSFDLDYSMSDNNMQFSTFVRQYIEFVDSSIVSNVDSGIIICDLETLNHDLNITYKVEDNIIINRTANVEFDGGLSMDSKIVYNDDIRVKYGVKDYPMTLGSIKIFNNQGVV